MYCVAESVQKEGELERRGAGGCGCENLVSVENQVAKLRM